MNILRNMLLLCAMLLWVACSNNDFPHPEGGASLHLTIKSSENTIRTRGVEDLDDDGTVSEEELFVDGRKMYRLAVFILDGNRVASSTVLEADDPRFANANTEATVSFTNLDYSKSYELYAVANYGNYAGLTGNLSNVTEDNVTSGLRVTSSGNNMCNHRTPYPLTLKKNISLTPGVNTVSGELLRTYARLRINVRNQSSLSNLTIENFSLAQKFTQQSADLFAEGGTANVSPVVTSSDAITPFVQNKVIEKITSSGGVSEQTIFDSYLLESTGGNYSYTLGLKYEGDSEEVYSVNTTAINNAGLIDEGMYVIYNTNSGRYLYANGNSVGSGTSYLTNGELNHNYVWKFTRAYQGSNMFTIESMGATGYFMQSSGINGSRVPLTVNPGSSDYFSPSTSGSYIRFRDSNFNYYLSVNGSTVCGHNSSRNQNRRNFYLYKVTKESKVAEIEHEETIPINIIDKNSGEASPLTAIRRNDFIEILVNVTYNEKTGNLEFEVSDWNEVNGDVTFD
ncbi:MAG: hypothetical protein E7089_05485 [Bacteroidales bacterium]|nr:hypothetical protein [Bacteroidales bacterium]